MKNTKMLEKQLRSSEVRYRRLFETAHDGILILDSKTGQITDVNPYLVKLLGYSKDEFLDKKLWEVGAFKNFKASKEAFKILQKEGFVRYDDLPLETIEGTLIDVEFVSNSYMAGDELVIQCNIRDITERKTIDAIRESKRLLEIERLKVSSIADATHELRTPVAIIKGNVELAMRKRNKNSKTPRATLKAINHEIDHLSGILADLSLITSRAWELKNRVNYEEIELKPFFIEIVKRCMVIAAPKHVSLTLKKVPNLTMLGDRMYLERMFTNILRNSIIYGKRNGDTIITITKTANIITTNITDNGIGISKEDIPHVFERFYRADKYHSSTEKNSVGLGLSIVKWVAELHGGEVTVTSMPNNGSTFSVSLPIKSSNKI